MTAPAGHDARSPAAAPDGPGGRPRRPATIDAVAALLVFGGLFGATQLLFGDYVITGSLPAKGPILGVAAILYAASVVLGVLIRTGRGWFAALNLAGLFAIVYLAAFGQAVAVLLGIGHGMAAVLLVRTRSWFVAMARSRVSDVAAVTSAVRAVGQRRPAGSRRGGRYRPSSRR